MILEHVAYEFRDKYNQQRQNYFLRTRVASIRKLFICGRTVVALSDELKADEAVFLQPPYLLTSVGVRWVDTSNLCVPYTLPSLLVTSR